MLFATTPLSCSSSSARWLILLAHLLTFWPLWPWFAQRLADGGDEAWGILSLITAVVFVFREAHYRAAANPSEAGWPITTTSAHNTTPQGFSLSEAGTQEAQWFSGLLWSAGFTLLYAASYLWLPPLARAGLAVSALTFTVSACFLNRRFHPGIWGLLLLALPVMESLQFYVGYPLRTIVSMLASGLLRLGGLAVIPHGAVLGWGDTLVAVDAPCSGIRMLWVGAYLVVALACFYRLSFARLVSGAALSLVVLVLGNALRATALFYLEVELVPAVGAAHTAIGIVTFAITAAAIVVVIEFLRRRTACVR